MSRVYFILFPISNDTILQKLILLEKHITYLENIIVVTEEYSIKTTR